MISSRIAVLFIAGMFLALIALVVFRGREQQKPAPAKEVPVELAPAPDELPATGEVANLLGALRISPEIMISRTQKAAVVSPVVPEIAPETKPEAKPETKPEVAEKKVPAPATPRIGLQYVQPSAMVSLVNKTNLATNIAAAVESDGESLTDERGVSDLMAKSYIKKTAMLSRPSESFSSSWITYANREKSHGFISDGGVFDASDVNINIPGPKADNPDLLNRALYYIREAEAGLRKGDTEQAIALYTQALAAYPDMMYVNRQMGRISLMRGEYDQAIRYLKEALDADEYLGETLNDLGTAYLYAGRGEEALETFQAALEASPLSLDPLFNSGLTLRVLKRLDEARALYEKYLESDKYDARVYRELAVIDIVEGRADDALARLETAIALDNSWYTPLLDAAFIYAEKGDYIKTINMLKDALELAPAWVIYNVYNQPAMKEVRLIPESMAFEAALAEKARTHTAASPK